MTTPTTRALPTLSYQEGRLRMDEISRRESLPSQRTITQAYRIRGPFDPAALRSALREVVARHAALRTTFTGGPHRQHVRDEAEPRLDELSVAGEADPEAAAVRAARTAALAPFAADEAPRLRATLITLAEADRVLVLAFDHLVVDAWSRGLVLDELGACYRASRAGEASGLPEVEYGYEDHIRDQQELLTGPEYERLLSYWSKTLDGTGAIPRLVTGRADTGLPVDCGTAVVRMPAPLADEVRALASRERSTLFLVVLTALQVALRLHGGGSDQATAVNLYNRDTLGTERLVAPLAELMVVRVDSAGAGTFRDALRLVRDGTLDAQEHAGLPYPELVKALNPAEYARPDAPVGVVLNMLYAELLGGAFDTADATCAPFAVPQTAARPRSELMVVGSSGPDGLDLSARYQSDRVDAGFVTRLLDTIVEILTTAARRPDVPLAELTAAPVRR
ncbi:condensation domain-containing protein [Streptomyces hydrogenans]|uniref:condensation domain-containing protein n=1 Tax=Streptomyces hydrogenans TaxID=1873719 RepID=UPI0035DCB732